jgi:flagellar protein FliL
MANPPLNKAAQEGVKDLPEAKPKKSKMRSIVGAAILLALLTGVIFFLAPWILPGKSKEQVKAGPSEVGTHGHIYDMEPFLVNLADPAQPRYLKIRVGLESSEAKANEEYGKKLPQLRDAILTVLSSKTFKDISDSEGKNKLKEEILSKVNPVLSHFRMKRIYFTEFVVQ